MSKGMRARSAALDMNILVGALGPRTPSRPSHRGKMPPRPGAQPARDGSSRSG